MNFKKANIVIITLFIIILTAIIGLITTKYVLNLLKVSSENFKYYKAYYIAYGWLELELLKTKNHWYWFEDKILSTSDTVKKNFTWKNYYFKANIYSLTKHITNTEKSLVNDSINCSNKKNWVTLATWDGLMTPLFYDKNNQEATISGKNYDTLNIANAKLYYSWDIVLNYNEEASSDDLQVGKQVRKLGDGNLDIYSSIWNPSLDVDKKPFIVVWWNTKSQICISNTSDLVSPYTYVVSEWSFMDRKVSVKMVKYNKWAQFSIYWLY